MTEPAEDARGVRPGRQRISIVVAAALCAPGILARLAGVHGKPGVMALLFGLAIVGAAFLLSWAAEVAQLDISAGLAIALLAFIAVLPEYAVDTVFAWKGGKGFREFGSSCHAAGSATESPCSLALANMTGANRLLIGVGWSLVVFLAWWAMRRRDASPGHTGAVATPGIAVVAGTDSAMSGIALDRTHSVELAFLAVASAYSLTLPLKQSITLIDAAVLISLFVVYTVRISRAPAEEPELVGPAMYIGTFTTRNRRLTVGLFFVFAAGVILLCAEPFAESLVAAGAELGVSEFLLVQWLAPLASETPELLVAGLYAWRLNTNAGLGTLVSSKVNQWTLLVGTLPIVFAIASGSTHGLPIIARQREELFLTAAQSVFAVAILINLSISVREAGMLFALFWAQFVIGAVVPASWHGAELVVVGIVYLVLAAGYLVAHRRSVPQLLRDGVRTEYAELTRQA
ncbi:MAG: sodium:proton exchanger [Actinomycetota bacterium]|nr:sodium:proton exchanger [Actinomycetota bacterium]